jgi:uncharacterized membrane protein
MSAALAHGSWPSPRRSPRVFAREVVLTALPGAPRALQWLLARQRSITPRQLGAIYLALCAASLVIAASFTWHGTRLVLALAGLELSAVGAALLYVARHAHDHETLTLVGRSLAVEQCFGRRVRRTDFAADGLTVEPAAGQGSLVEIAGRGQRVRVGRLLHPRLRGALAEELRLALRRAVARKATGPDWA